MATRDVYTNRGYNVQHIWSVPKKCDQFILFWPKMKNALILSIFWGFGHLTMGTQNYYSGVYLEMKSEDAVSIFRGKRVHI